MIDAHLHINFNGLTKDNFINYLDRNGFEKAWLLTWDEIEPEKKKWDFQNLNIEDVWDLYEKYPDKVVPFYAPDPLRANALELFIKWHKKGVKGYGELKSTIRWSDKRLDKILDYLNENKLPLIFHIENRSNRIIEFDKTKFYGEILNKILHSKLVNYFSEPLLEFLGKYLDFDKIPCFYKFPGYMLDFIELEERLKQYPNIKFIAHGPFWWTNISTNELYRKYPKGKIQDNGIIIRLLSVYNNLYCDISGLGGYNALNRDCVYSEKFMIRFQDKIVFGTDNYEFDLIKLLNKKKINNFLNTITKINPKKILEWNNYV